MNTLLASKRELRETYDPYLRARENSIQKIMVSYGYDRENAEKVYEIGRVRAAESLFGATCGAIAVFKYAPVGNMKAKSYGMFRKTWMRFPIPIAVFSLAYYISTMLPSRFGRKISFSPTVTHNTYTS
jgi:hypothetical protein